MLASVECMQVSQSNALSTLEQQEAFQSNQVTKRKPADFQKRDLYDQSLLPP